MPNIRIANAPCSWGSLEFEGLQGEAIAYGQMLDELVETGYRGTELGDWGYMPTEPEPLHAELAARDVALLGAFVPVALADEAAHEEGEARSLRVARLIAEAFEMSRWEQPPWFVLADDNGTDAVRTGHAGRVTPELALSDAGWDTLARGAERIARAVKQQTGLRTVFHHHCAGYVETPDEIARLMETTDPQLLGLVLDTGHFTYGSGGDDPALLAAALDRFGRRIWYIHLKDCHRAVAAQARRDGGDYFQAVRDGVFCELGQGCVDFPAVVKWLEQHDYDGWAVVEQDVLPGMGTPCQSARRNRRYLLSLGI